MLTTVIKWRIYCNTEDNWSVGFLDETSGQPSSCFNDVSHEVNQNSIQEIQRISETKVIISEEDTPTGGKFKAVCYKHTCTPGVNVRDYTFPYAISALAVKFVSIEEHRNDELELHIAPDTTIGTLTSSIVIDDTILPVSSTVLLYASVGVYIKITDGVNEENLGIVTEVDTINSTITIETPVTYNYSHLTPTLIKMTIKSIDNFIIGHPSLYNIGESKIGSSYVPANTILRVKYTNNGVDPVDNYYNVEYMY